MKKELENKLREILAANQTALEAKKTLLTEIYLGADSDMIKRVLFDYEIKLCREQRIKCHDNMDGELSWVNLGEKVLTADHPDCIENKDNL